MICCKRVHEPPAAEDGWRVLVDRLWPRGIRRDALVLDEWLPEAAPSTELRRAFAHDPQRFAAFRQGYLSELAGHPEHWWMLLGRAGRQRVTLLYAARDTEHNNARVLADFLEDELERQQPASSPVCYLDVKPEDAGGQR
ncbi:DUF488 domain-containing protein [Pseudomonas mangrovi]|uniref:DUF488 domain-containing protein n=1 Tax=Pseudomonas mangrovi TaxID=2161748 RepID=A0A2T5PBU0_9PSED|nr:DUF488 domain-containing protein [Pseudomonas mangrovi]PTU75167.1 DUF488 domain-containing protein [Pseudomonas mangrovi]